MSISHSELLSLLHYDPETGQWHARPKRADTKTGSKGYRQVVVGGKQYQAHRLAFFYMTGKRPTKQIDHKDCNPSNNTWKNLREATRAQNRANTPLRKNNTSGFKGVNWDKRTKKWRACIVFEGKKITLGFRFRAAEARFLYVDAAYKYYGEFARAQ